MLNAVQNGAICESMRINIPYNGIIKPFRTIKDMAKRCKIAVKKYSFRG